MFRTLLAICVSIPACCWAQTASVSGELSGGPHFDSRWQVELRPLHEPRTGPSRRAPVSMSGHFHFANIGPGTYEAIVLDAAEREIKRDLVLVNGFSATVLQIRMEAAPPGSGAARPPVSLHRLSHRVPKSARKAFEAGGRAARKEQFDLAETYFTRALELDPGFAEAANDLGALLYRRSKYTGALAVLEQARQLDPASPAVLSNLSAVHLALASPLEAEALARQAHKLEPRNVRAAYMLGLSRMWQGKNDAETVELLEQATGLVPHARLALARVHSLNGHRDAARTQLEAYLGGNGGGNLPPAQRTQAEAWLKSLR